MSRNDLAKLPSNRFEALSGNRKGQFGIRANQQWLNLPKIYELRCTEQEEGEQIKRTILRRSEPSPLTTL